MKRIISFVLCLSMLFSMLPVSVFASDVEETVVTETTAAIETTQVPETQAPTQAPVVETTAAVEETAAQATVPAEAPAEETAAATEAVPETTAAEETVEPTVAEVTAPQETVVEETTWEYTYIPAEDFPDSEELFAVYAESKLYGTEIATFGTAAGEMLEGDTKAYYDILVPEIKKIANGSRTSSAISLTSKGFDFDINALLSALLSDLVYELYWFDKVSGISCYGRGNSITFEFFVAANYSASGAAETCDLDTDKTGATTTAVETAKAIVEENASKSDYDKLLNYKNKVCDLTSYNTSAANKGDFSGNDDPWQLIYVFDGLQSTKVVCEGYSKAFQYLCDLSDFSADVTCYNVSGTMSGGTGAGAHMWNIVRINGKSYLADITNSDAGTVGSNGKLFMAGKEPNSNGSYTIGGVKFTYGEETKSLWGTGESSILTLATENYDPNTATQDPSGSVAPPTNAEELLNAVNAANGGTEVIVWDAITITEDMTLSSEALLSFADYASLTVTNGATLTLNCPTNINGAQLVVEEGATLVSNVDLTINNPQDNGGKAVFNGSFENNGSFWVNTGSTADINGYAVSNGPIFVGFGGNSRLSINGQLDACAYLCVNEGGELSLSPGAKLNLLGAGGGYLDNSGTTYLSGDVYIEGLMTSGARTDEETGEVVGSDAIIEIRGSVTGTDTSSIGVGAGGSIDCYGPVTTAGEVVVEKGGAFWVDHTVTLTGPAPLTVNGWLHIDYLDEYATADGLLNLETTANVNGYLHVCDGGTLNATNTSVLNILNDENGCGYLDNQGNVYLHGAMNLDGLFTTGAACDENGNVIDANAHASAEIRGTITGSDTSSLGVGANGSLNCYGTITTGDITNNGEFVLEAGSVLNLTGILTGNALVNNGGTFNEIITDPQEYFERLLVSSDNPWLTFDLTLEQDVEINCDLWIMEGATLTVPEGVTVTVNNRIFINEGCALITESGSKLVNNLTIANGGGTVTLASGTYVAASENARVENAYGNGHFGTITGIPVTEQRMYMGILQESDFQVAQDLMRDRNYRDLSVSIDTDLVLEDLTIPANTALNVGNLILENGVTVTINGTLTVEDPETSHLHVREGSTLVLNGTAYNHGEVQVGGTLKLSNGATFNNQGGWLHNHGSFELGFQENIGTIECGEGSLVFNTMVGGVLGDISGVPYEHLGADVRAESSDDIYALFEQASPEEYCDITVVTEKSLTLDRDLTIPEVGFINVLSRDGSPVTLTIAEDVSVTNHGYIYVVGTGAELVNNGYINSFGQLNAMNGGAVILNGVLDNWGIVTVDGTIENNFVIWVDSGAQLHVAEGGYIHSFAGYGVQAQQGSDGSGADITGVPTEYQALCRTVLEDSHIRETLDKAASEGYGVVMLDIGNTIRLSRDLTIPENVFVHIAPPQDEEGNVIPVTFTVPANVTVTNNGYFSIPENGTVVIDGNWIGELPIVNGGTLTGKLFEMTAEKLNERLRSGGEVCLYNDLMLTEDLVIPDYASLRIVGAELIVPEEIEIANYGLLEVADSGTLTVNGGLSNFHTGGCLNILSGGTVKVNGTVHNGTVTNVLGGSLVINGNWEGYGPVVEDGGTVSGKGQPSAQDALETLLKSAAVNGYPASLTSKLVLTRDLTIPAGASLTIRDGGQIVVPGGKTLYVEGELHVTNSVDKEGNGEAGLLLRSGKLVNNGLIAVYNLGIFDASNGTYEQADWASLHRVYRGDDNDPEVPFFAADIIGIPLGLTTIMVDYPNAEAIRVVSAIAAWAEENGEPFREVRYNIERTMTLADDLAIPENGYLWIGESYHDSFVTLTVPAGVTLTNNGCIEITVNGKLVMEGTLEGYQPWTTGGGEYVSADVYTEAELRADIAEAAAKGQQLFMCRHVTLTDDLTVPAGMCLTIGQGGQLIVPQGVTLTVEGDLQVLESVEGDGEAGLLLYGGKLVNNNLIITEGFGIIDASNGTYEQADWALLKRIYHDYGEAGIHPSDVIGIPMSSTMIIAADATEELFHMVLTIVEQAETLGDSFSGVRLDVAGRELRLTDDLTIPDGVTMYVRDGGTLIVPDGITLTNNGNIDIGWAGTVIVEAGGKLAGNHPNCFDIGSTYINENIFTQHDLEQLIADAQETGDNYAILSVPVTLTSDMEIPSGFRLQITGRDNFITIPEGVKLTNNGQITCQMFGGILAQGGTLVNDGPINVLNWGTVDMWNGEYIPWGNGMVYNHHARYTDGYEEHATVVGFHPFHVQVLTGGDEDSLLHELIGFIDHVSQDGYYSNLSSSIMGSMTLTGDLYWPGYATMTIPEGLTVTIPQGVTLDNWGTIYLYGELIVEGTLTGNGQLIAGSPDCIIGNTDSRIIIPGVALEDYTIGVSDLTTNVGGSARVWVETVEPAYAEFYGYYDMEIIAGDGWISEDRVFSNTPGTVTVAVKPIVGYDYENDSAPIYAETVKTVDITFAEQIIGHFFTDSADFFENFGTPDGSYGLWAGGKATFYPVLMNVNGEVVGTDGITATYSEGYEQFATIAVKNGNYTVTALKTLASHEVISITFTAEGAASTTVNFHLRPKAETANVVLDGTTVTGKTITVDVNRSDLNRQLNCLIGSAEAVPVNGALIEGVDASDKPMVQWTSSNAKVAAVDENGLVTFTGEAGTVKITLTATYGAKKTATVTFKAVALAQEILPGANLTTEMIGGKAATYSVTDGSGNALAAKAVEWYLVDANGNPMASNPYASINAKGKLTTKAVSDPYEVYIMAKVLGTEDGATLAEPITVTLYPAVTAAYIRVMDFNNITANNMTLRWAIDTHGETCQLYYNVAPYAESVKSVSWKSSKPAIADIDQNGLITVNGTGTAKFTLTVEALDGKKTNASVTFTFGNFGEELLITAKKGSEELDTEALTIYGGESITFSANADVKWSLEDPAAKAYASISGKGVLKAKNVTNPVTVWISAVRKDGFRSESFEVTILPKPVTVQGEAKEALLIQNDIGEYITKSTITLTPGTETWLYASEDVTWTSSKPDIATIDETGKLITLVNGATTITATTDDGRKATVNVKVGKVAESIEITAKNDADFVVASGKALNLIGTVTYSDGSVDKKVTWSLDWNDCGAKISGSGKLTAPKGITEPTSVYAVAISKDGFAMDYVEVEIVPLATGVEIYGPFDAASSYDVDISNTTQKWDLTTQGSTFYLYAGVFPNVGMQNVTWKSSAAKVASVDAEGRVTCLKAGTATITATAADGSNKKASFKLTVVKTMAYLELPQSAIIGSGKSLAMTKLDGFAMDNQAANKSLIWTLTDLNGNAVPKTVATLNNKGVLKANKKVAAPVDVLVRAEATDGSGLFAECVVTIFPVTKGIVLYSIDRSGEPVDVTGKTVSAPINEGYCILTDTTNVAGFGYSDDKTADEFLPNGSAWEISESPKLRIEYDGQAVCFYPTEEAKVGDSVRVTLKALDGSGKSANFTINITNIETAEAMTMKVMASGADTQANGWISTMLTAFEEMHPEYDITWDIMACHEGDAGVTLKDNPSTADVYMFANDQLGTLVEAGALMALDSDSEAAVRNRFAENYIDGLTHTDGNVYGVPMAPNTWFMMYNKDIFSEADVKSLNTMLDKGVVSFPMTNSWYTGSFFFGAGATIFGKQGIDASAGFQFGSDACMEVGRFMVELVNHPNFVNDENGVGVHGMKNGTVGAVFTGSWDYPALHEALGDKLGIVQLPTFTVYGTEYQMKSFSCCKAVGVNPNAENLDMAVKFAEFLSSSEGQFLRYELTTITPADPVCVDMIGNNLVLKAEAAQMKNASVVQPTIPEMYMYWAPMSHFGIDLVNGAITEHNIAEKINQLMAELNAY